VCELIAILHLRATGFVGGPERQILGQAQELPRHGFEAHIASFIQADEGAAFLDAAASRGLDVLPLPSAGPLDLSPAGRIVAEAARRRLKLICAHDPKSALVGYVAARRSGLPLVAWVRGWTGETWQVRLHERVHRWVLRRADLVIAVSAHQAELCRRAGVAAQRIRVIPNAVEVRRPTPGRDIRAEFGLPPSCRVVLSVGRLSPEKGHERLVAAAPSVLAEHPDLIFLVLGEGPRRGEIERAAQGLGLNGRLLLPGFHPDASALMAGADLLVLPSLTEGMPNVVLEAFAAGVPVVATRVGGVPEVVLDGETGWLAERPTPECIASAMLQALADPEERSRRAANARALVRRSHTFAAQAAQAAYAFRSVLAETRP